MFVFGQFYYQNAILYSDLRETSFCFPQVIKQDNNVQPY